MQTTSMRRQFSTHSVVRASVTSDHTEFYSKSDAVLLDDVFESFIDVCLEKYYCKVQKVNLSWSSLVCYKIHTEEFYEDIKADTSTKFYTSKYPKDHA